MKTGIKIKSVKYISDYKLEITFNDGRINLFDYENLVMRNHEESVPYRDVINFKKFKLSTNKTTIVWGKNWDMILPTETIYNKKSVFFSGRKRVADKKILVRLYVNQSVVNANGGLEKARSKCEAFLNETHN
ncbi:MAG: DUF2442 domain-containing protein [Nanoarchaeota archaeon]